MARFWGAPAMALLTVGAGTLLAARSGADVLRYGSAGLFVLLLAAWLVVAVRTGHGALRGRLFLG